MAHLLATQVSEEDEKQRAAALAAPKAKPVEKKKKSWWQALCCGSESAEEEPPQSKKDEKAAVAKPQAPTDGKSSPQPQDAAAPSSEEEEEPERAEQSQQSEEPKWLLDPLSEEDQKKKIKTLVLDLDETLVHSSFTYIPDADFIIDIDLDGVIYKVYVRKRPGVDEFMRAVGEKFEVVIFTASLAKYADPLLDILDPDRIVSKRLFRESCVQHHGNYVKDLSMLGRKLEHSIIIDNSPFSYMFQPDNAIPITSWFNDKNDTELYELLPFLDSLIEIEDVSTVLQQKAA